MICANCKKDNTQCIDDMLEVGYVAEIYECNDCKGRIEVVYKTEKISSENIKTYRYVNEKYVDTLI